MTKFISSTSNPIVKNILKLSKNKERQQSGKFVIEGLREIERARKGGYSFEMLLFNKKLQGAEQSELLKHFENDSSVDLIEISENVFSRIAYRDNQDGILAITRQKHLGLSDLLPVGNSLYLVVETVEKPGNLGAMLRTADAANVTAMIVCDNQSDIYNPNVVRSSLGCLFTVPVISCSSAEAIAFLKANKVNIYSAALQDSKEYYNTDLTGPSAIVVGSEAEGLSTLWRNAADAIIRIPMFGIADSLNVSVSAAILIFEALRQRNKSDK